MSKRKNKEGKKKDKKNIYKIIIIILSIVLVIGLAGLGYIFYKRQSNEKTRELEIKNLEKNLQSVVLDYKDSIEYGTIWSFDDFSNNLIKKDKLDKTASLDILVNSVGIDETINYQFKKVGNLKLTIILTKPYKYTILKSYKEDLIVKKDIELKIEDTKLPVITGVQDKTITIGDKIDLLEGLEASDEVDGKLELKVEGTVDTNKAGTYEIKVSCSDMNGNISEAKFKVTVNEKPKQSTSGGSTSSGGSKKPSGSLSSSGSSSSGSTSQNDASTQAGRLNLAKAEAKRVASQIIKPGMSDYQKAEAIFNYLHNNVATQGNQSTEAYKTNFGNEAYAALVLKIAACSGFCKAVTLLCNEAGLRSQHINQNEWTHQWNLVYINGEWIVLDAQGGIFGGTRHPIEDWY